MVEDKKTVVERLLSQRKLARMEGRYGGGGKEGEWQGGTPLSSFLGLCYEKKKRWGPALYTAEAVR